ncbi:hypothetical protein ACW6AV_001651 [Edwardsiella piscicida]|uniref:hypothetical protein n=1 Tax=Edwardsiella piscicida TaxID=1263550 RepID=UPI000D51773E|nr:hypothetical protein [Edwardsiella piscicida]EKS7767154.1 hypothetical protein [Edwardsiella piscicida]QBB13914.1 hypothetical protein EVK84_15905 [Edwardsiella piscicida]UCQ29729.1 hypothetical protein DCF74_09470 [Edwardsiella piscicida]
MRKQITYIVEDNNRDRWKEFIITEMSAWDADEMAQDLFRSMGESNFTGVPPDVIAMGCAGLATLGMNVLSVAPPEVSRNLRDRLIATVEVVIRHDGGQQIRKVIPEDFEEVETIRKLLDRVFEVNFSFLSIAAA